MLRKRFGTLDAMRGAAAITVLCYHVPALYGRPCSVVADCDVRYGYLAVDMFFALSGFVLSYRYDEQFHAGLRAVPFLRARAVRLLPTFWVGAALGIVALLLERGALGPGALLREVAPNLVMLPAPDLARVPVPFPLDPPAWSLFYELAVANVLFACGWRWLDGRVLAAVLAAGAAGLVAAGWHYGHLGLGSQSENFAGGLPRVLYSFFAGVAVQRLHRRRGATSVPAFAILAVLVLSFVVRVPAPFSLGYELACVILLYPALIYLGAFAIERVPRLGKLLGDVSYAVYAIHFPAAAICLWVMRRHDVAPGAAITAAFGVAVLVASLAINTVYDPRARRALGRLLLPVRAERAAFELTPPVG